MICRKKIRLIVRASFQGARKNFALTVLERGRYVVFVRTFLESRQDLNRFQINAAHTKTDIDDVLKHLSRFRD